MQEILGQLKTVIKDLYGLDVEPDLTPSPENIDADYSTNIALKLAKDLHKSPMQIAGEIEKCLTRAGDGPGRDPQNFCESKTSGELVSPKRVTAVGGDPQNVYEVKFRGRKTAGRPRLEVASPGFLNFTLPDDYLSYSIENLNTNYASDKLTGQTVICEFSDPNPFKVLHVGHLYTSIVGDSIARLFEYAGAKVVRANFGGDVGLHVAKTMYVLRQKPIDKLTIEDIAKCYVEGTAAYEDDEKAHEEITELNKEIYRINAAGPARIDVSDDAANLSSSLAELYWKGRELSYDYFKDFYAKIGIKFDKFYPESTVAGLGLKKVREQLEKGVYEYSDGAVIFDGEKYGLHTRVFINREGVPTYETKDVGLIFTKWQDYHFDKSIVITGNEQLDYMRVVLKSVNQYAPELVEKTTHLTHGLVKLPGNVKMSSRKGNFLKAVDVLDMVREELKAEHNSTDETVALAATKYAFLKYKMGGNIIFDPKESVKMTGNSGPYLLYSCVRAKKILSRSNRDNLKANIRDNESGIASEPRNDGRERSGSCEIILMLQERNLIKKTLEYRTTLDEAVLELAPHKVATYLYELAQEFSRFYENCPVAGSDRENERTTLVKAYLDTMSHGLGILGISIPESM